MFGFRKKTATAPVPESPDTLRTLAGRIDDMEAAHRRLVGEWTDWLERAQRVLDRLAKRAARAEAQEPDAPRPITNGSPHPTLPGLDTVSERIRAQRRGSGSFPGGSR